ncbi:TPA: hypothetical protein NWA32_004090 [Escherichia coli]|nr:hypothetical protein [Escherichia coli]
MKNADVFQKIAEVVRLKEAGQINTSIALAKIAALSKRYGNSHAVKVNTQANEVRMGCSRKTQPRDAARH